MSRRKQKLLVFALFLCHGIVAMDFCGNKSINERARSLTTPIMFTYIPFLLRLVAAAILAQTLFFKFTGAEESVWIFQQLGAEPWGRIGSGVVEAIAALLLLVPKTAWLGALAGLGTMAGAVFSHLFVLGIEVKGDGGTLFFLALIVLVCCGVTLWLRRRDIPVIGSRF
jgi:uncharacterized membrane protein YphA (DoxX/SURF4 family)